jgi:hypothetical protein
MFVVTWMTCDPQLDCININQALYWANKFRLQWFVLNWVSREHTARLEIRSTQWKISCWNPMLTSAPTQLAGQLDQKTISVDTTGIWSGWIEFARWTHGLRYIMHSDQSSGHFKCTHYTVNVECYNRSTSGIAWESNNVFLNIVQSCQTVWNNLLQRYDFVTIEIPV